MRDQHSPLRLLVFTLASVVTLLVFSLASFLTTPVVSGQGTDPTADVTEAPPVDATAEADPGPREIEDALGTVTIEGTPERVVVLEWTYAEDLIAVGLEPVGVADVEGYNAWVNVEPALSEDVTDVGTRQEPSLESIAALEPDLIIGVQFRHEPIYDDLSAIAPTLLFNPYPEEGADLDQYAEMEQTFLAIADAVNRTTQAEAVLDDLHASFEDAAAVLAESGHVGEPFVLAQAYTAQDAPQIRLFTDNSMAAQILASIGLDNAWQATQFEIYGFSTVDVEALATVETADFFYVVQDADNVFENQLAENPVWSNLAFVREDRAYALGGDMWLFGGPLSAQLLVDKVVTLLTTE